MTTGFVFDPGFLEHDTGPGHPERPERASAIVSHLGKLPWTKKLQRLPAQRADLRWIRSIHADDYLRRAEAACRKGAPYLDSMDVAISPRSYDVALLAAGAPLVLADAIIGGAIRNGFALVRPPGHHAEYDAALGFCLFNNVAILARYLQQQHGIDKVAIVDWDVHHGNGTQHAFETDPSVLYISLHQHPFYPGTGAASEQGEGKGKGTVVNCPMPAGAGDSAYERAFAQRIVPALDAFAPDILLISAGFDAHRDDPLAEIQLSTGAFAWMSRQLIDVAESTADGRIISVLEGGYNLSRIGECVAAHLDELRRAALP